MSSSAFFEIVDLFPMLRSTTTPTIIPLRQRMIDDRADAQILRQDAT